MNAVYLGDGLYTSFDGDTYRLWTARANGTHEVFLDDRVLVAFESFIATMRENARDRADLRDVPHADPKLAAIGVRATPDAHVDPKQRWPGTFCSQCGKSLGPGDAGVSRCVDHAAPCGRFIDVVLDGPPSHESGRFVEVEDEQGNGISCGQWIDRGDGRWALRIEVP